VQTIRSALGILFASIALAGCSEPIGERSNTANAENVTSSAVTNTSVENVSAPDPAPPTAARDDSNSQTLGGDGSPIVLSALSGSDIDSAQLPGELTCSFETSDAGPLLIAKGNVASQERAQGVVKVLDYVEQVSAAGGFNAIIGGATFQGKGKTVRVTLTGDAPTSGGESPSRLATLTYDRADGASRTFPGSWTCGP
jgi:hypothetical protein